MQAKAHAHGSAPYTSSIACKKCTITFTRALYTHGAPAGLKKAVHDLAKRRQPQLRNSPLTRLLAPSLSGHAHVVVIVCSASRPCCLHVPSKRPRRGGQPYAPAGIVGGPVRDTLDALAFGEDAVAVQLRPRRQTRRSLPARVLDFDACVDARPDQLAPCLPEAPFQQCTDVAVIEGGGAGAPVDLGAASPVASPLLPPTFLQATMPSIPARKRVSLTLLQLLLAVATSLVALCIHIWAVKQRTSVAMEDAAKARAAATAAAAAAKAKLSLAALMVGLIAMGGAVLLQQLKHYLYEADSFSDETEYVAPGWERRGVRLWRTTSM